MHAYVCARLRKPLLLHTRDYHATPERLPASCGRMQKYIYDLLMHIYVYIYMYIQICKKIHQPLPLHDS